MNYAKRLLTRANENSITFKELAVILKVTPAAINHWINGSNTSYGRYKLYNERMTTYILNRKTKEGSTRDIEDYKYDFLMQMLNKAGKTNVERSRFLEVPKGTIWNWVNKKYFPAASKIIAVAERTNTPLPEWLSESKQLSFEDIKDSYFSSICEDSKSNTENITSEPLKNEPTATVNRYMRITKEPKTKRVNLVVRPTVYTDFQEKTKANGQSVNDALNDLMELYLNNDIGKTSIEAVPEHSFNLTFSEDEIDRLFDCLHLEHMTGKNVPDFYNSETGSYSINNNELVQYIIHDWIAAKFIYYKDKLKGV